MRSGALETNAELPKSHIYACRVWSIFWRQCPQRLRPYVRGPGGNTPLRGTPDLKKLLNLSRELDISREAGARRWLELHEEKMALIFAKRVSFATLTGQRHFRR